MRVGLWWILAWALLLFVAQIDFKLFLAWGVPVGPPTFRLLQFQANFGPAAWVAADMLLPGLWLWVAAIAVCEIRKMFSEVAAPHLAISRAAQFSVAWVQGMPLLPAAALGVIYTAMARRTMYDGPFSLGQPVVGAPGQGEYWTAQYFLNNSLSGVIGDIVLAMVLIAVYVLTNRLRYSLILLVAVKLVPIVNALSQAVPKPPNYDYVNLGGSPLAYTCWLGLLVAALMLWGFRQRRAWVAWPSYGLLVGGSALAVLQRWIVPLPPFEMPEPLRVTLASVADTSSHLFARGQTFLLPLRDDASNLYAGAHRLTVYGAGADVVMQEPWSALAVAVVINMLWLALIWIIIRWCILRQAPDAAAD